MQDLNDKVTGGTLGAAEWNQVPSELQNVIESLGIVLSSGDLNQLGKAIAGYVANGAFYTDGGVADAYSLSVVGSKQGPTEYTDGMLAVFRAGNVNTGASTVNVAGLGLKNIKRENGDDPPAGSITPDGITVMRYSTSAGNFILDQSVTNAFPLTTAGTSTAYTITYGITAYQTGRVYLVDFDQACGDSPTIDFDTLGAKDIYYKNGFPVTAGAVEGVHTLEYDGTNMVVLDPHHVTMDLSSYAGADYELQIGETAFYDVSAVSSKALRIALPPVAEYRLRLYSDASTIDIVQLLPNNTSYIGEITTRVLTQDDTTLSGSTATTFAAFRIGENTLSASVNQINIDNVTANETVVLNEHIRGVIRQSNYGNWSQSVAHTSLGTINLVSGTFTGKIIVTRVA